MSNDADDVVGVLTERIEDRFGMGIDTLKAAVAAAPNVHREATAVMHWHGLLTESQAVLEHAEDTLLDALETQPSLVDDPTMGLAQRVNAAVATRDGRALVVRRLLDPDSLDKQGLAAERQAHLNRGARHGPAVPTSAPARPVNTPAAGRGATR